MDIVLRNNADQPIYQQIKSQMADQILCGTLSEGQQLPSIRGLAKALGISVITTKRAYEELENEGYIDTVPGKGTFVSLRDRTELQRQQQAVVTEELRQTIAQIRRAGMELEELLALVRHFYEEG